MQSAPGTKQEKQLLVGSLGAVGVAYHVVLESFGHMQQVFFEALRTP